MNKHLVLIVIGVISVYAVESTVAAPLIDPGNDLTSVEGVKVCVWHRDDDAQEGLIDRWMINYTLRTLVQGSHESEVATQWLRLVAEAATKKGDVFIFRDPADPNSQREYQGQCIGVEPFATSREDQRNGVTWRGSVFLYDPLMRSVSKSQTGQAIGGNEWQPSDGAKRDRQFEVTFTLKGKAWTPDNPSWLQGLRRRDAPATRANGESTRSRATYLPLAKFLSTIPPDRLPINKADFQNLQSWLDSQTREGIHLEVKGVAYVYDREFRQSGVITVAIKRPPATRGANEDALSFVKVDEVAIGDLSCPLHVMTNGSDENGLTIMPRDARHVETLKQEWHVKSVIVRGRLIKASIRSGELYLYFDNDIALTSDPSQWKTEFEVQEEEEERWQAERQKRMDDEQQYGIGRGQDRRQGRDNPVLNEEAAGGAPRANRRERGR